MYMTIAAMLSSALYVYTHTHTLRSNDCVDKGCVIHSLFQIRPHYIISLDEQRNILCSGSHTLAM